MARSARWKSEGYDNGVSTYTLSSWKYFHDFIEVKKLLDHKTYIYRGQRNENWLLEPSINRFLNKQITSDEYDATLNNHLEEFKFSIRGRLNNLAEIASSDDELWALGQHHGLKTPLLDFTFSPYVAAYFAFIDNDKLSDYRVIWAASQFTTKQQVGDELELFRPVSGHNSRLINQNGLFIKFNVQDDIETIFKSAPTIIKNEIHLFKIRIPNKDRQICLRFLNRMNINHSTLFPDVYGASIFCNTHLDINKY